MERAVQRRKARRRPGAAEDGAARPAAEPRTIAPDPDLLARQERLLDEGLEETFPASDPVAVMRIT